MTDTVLDLVTGALRKIGVLAEGEVASAAQATDALEDLNSLLDQGAAERLTIYQITRTVFDLIPDQADYPISLGVPAAAVGDVDGFDTLWVTTPPGWTEVNTGSGATTNDSIVFQAGGHSVKQTGGASGTTTMYQDYTVDPGAEVTISIYNQVAVPGSGVMRVQNLETTNYLDSTGAWGATASDVFTADDLAFTQDSITFNVETVQSLEPVTFTLRVSFIATFTSVVNWDTYVFAAAAGDVTGIPRPVFIDRVAIIDTSISPETEIPVQGPLLEEAYQNIRQKDLTSTLPTAAYYNPTFPQGTLTFWPVPDSTTLQGVIYVPTQVPEFSGLSEAFSLPPGYKRMLVTNLALELSPSYRIDPSPLLVKQAMDSMAAVKRVNRRATALTFDAGALVGNFGRFNIRTDW